MRLNKIISTNKEKKKLLDQYVRNVKLIEDAFDQIKESTGISSIDEIVTTFIKAEEQNYSLFNYVNCLGLTSGQGTDQLEETNRKIKQDIETFKKNRQLERLEREKHIEGMENDIDGMDEEIQKSTKEKDEFKGELRTIQGHVEKMVTLFKKSKFILAVANKMSYEEGTTFNETNVIHYLSELEEYISSLITYNAFRKEEPFAAISAIPFEKLSKKEFEKGKLPVETMTQNQLQEKLAVLGEAEEGKEGVKEKEGIVNPRELYQKYLQLESKGLLQGIIREKGKPQIGPNIVRNND